MHQPPGLSSNQQNNAAADGQSRVDDLNSRFANATPQQILGWALGKDGPQRLALVSSFGTESAVLLHLAAAIDPAVEVLFIETGKHFPETLEYRAELAKRLCLTNVRDVTPDTHEIATKDAKGMRFSYDPDQCCAMRKVRPLERFLKGYDATISGRKAFQSDTREAIQPFEIDGARMKINPLGHWTKDRLESYFGEYNLPRHPLEAEGYLSIGCAPCTSKVLPGEDIRAGRWRQFDKTECGIHVVRRVDMSDAQEGGA